MGNKHQPFGKYILLEKLASGGMAEVYLAKSSGIDGIGKFFAIKKILPQFSSNTSFINMFKDEAKITVNLSHGNIAPIFEFGVEQGQFYLVMEFIEGRNLRQFLNFMEKESKTFYLEQVVFMCKEVSKGLDHAHRCLDGTTGKPLNIIHRDVGPQNIMLSFEGELKLIDFGIAKAESQIDTTRAGTLKGKFSYMSPEQAEGLPIDLRTDIFSLGIFMWEMLANSRLFQTDNEINTLRKIRDCQIPSLKKINPSIPAELERIVNKSLAKDRNLRYQTCAALNRDLSRFLNTNYPEFSTQDFSLFIKTLYSKAIAQNRQKMMAYAKINISDLSTTEDTLSLEDSSYPPKKKLPDNLLKQFTASNFKLSPLRENNDVLPEVTFSKPDKNTPPIVDTSSSHSSNSSHSSHSSHSSYSSHSSHSSYPQNTTKKANTRRVLRWAMLGKIASSLVVVTTATVLLIPYFLSKKSKIFIVDVPKKQHLEQASEENKIIPSKDFSLVIRTTPPGAHIFINGKATSIMTPGKIRYQANKPFSISLIKSGYSSYERHFSLNANKSLRAPLLPLNQGFVDINVFNPGINTEIYINGQKIPDPLPIKRYPVPADKKLVIKAVNAFRRTFDERVLKLKANKKAIVNLLLRKKKHSHKEKRFPSNK